MTSNARRRVLVLGGGFGGVFTAKHLRRRAGNAVDIVLISRHNFFVFQPLLPEIAGGSINPGDGVTPLRRFLPGVAVMVAEIREIDLGAKTVHVTLSRESGIRTVPYDQLVIALGQVVDLSRTPGLADRALVMKDVLDAFHIRNQVLGCLEDADAATDPRRRQSLLTFVVIGGGFTGVETIGEVQELIRKSLKYYPSIRADEIRTILIQHGARILPELPEHLASYATEQLRRRNIEIRLNTGVKAATPTGVETGSGPPIDAETIIAAIGNAPSPLTQSLPVALEHGRIVVDRCMRVQDQEDVWAFGMSPHPAWRSERRPCRLRAAARAVRVSRGEGAGAEHPRPPRRPSAHGIRVSFARHHGGTRRSQRGCRYHGRADQRVPRVGRVAPFLSQPVARHRHPSAGRRGLALDLLVSPSIAEIRAAQPASGQVRFLAGDLVVEPGIEPDGLYVVTSGAFEIEPAATTSGGSRAQSRKIGPGGYFGMSIGGEGPSERARVRACEDSTAYLVDKNDLRRLATVSAFVGRRTEGTPTT